MKSKRYCKTLQLENDPQLMEAYRKVHAPGAVWSEVTQGMREVGIVDMEIYLHGNTLFMIMETVVDFDHEPAMAELASKPRQAEWEAYVSQFQNASDSNSADDKWHVMEKIYKMDL